MKKLSIEMLISEYGEDVVRVDKRLRVLSSNKCNLKKKKTMYKDSEYNKKLDEILREMELLRELKSGINGKGNVSYLDLDEKDIKLLSLDSLEKGLRSLSSIKSRNICDDEKVKLIDEKYEVYKKYKDSKKDENIGKVDYKKIIECVNMVSEYSGDINKEFVLNMLNNLMK